tara:strand:- start:488 stop:733 length:246 start_codon:yes stop_codon:yes gene_type:complete
MNNSEKLLKLISTFIENGILTTQDVKKEMMSTFKFNKDNLAEKLKLVSREEFEVLKKIVQKQNKEINKLKRIKAAKKVKKS